MVRHTFEPVSTHRRKAGKCPICGRRVTRSQTFIQTINPFNRRDDGAPKTRAEVREDVEAEADAWTPDFTHASCREAGS